MKIVSSERGQINILLVPFILTILLLLVAIGFAGWAYMERQDYKERSDKKSAAAVAVAVDKTKSEKDNEFVEKEKEPLQPYTGPEALGGITYKYPKTWSTYVNQTSNNQLTVLGHPDTVVGGEGSSYALRVEVVSQPYDNVAKQFDNLVKTKKVTATAYSLPKVPKVVGLRFDGAITTDRQGAVVILPLRDKTIKISTESTNFIKDFNGIILPNFTFNP